MIELLIGPALINRSGNRAIDHFAHMVESRREPKIVESAQEFQSQRSKKTGAILTIKPSVFKVTYFIERPRRIDEEFGLHKPEPMVLDISHYGYLVATVFESTTQRGRQLRYTDPYQEFRDNEDYCVIERSRQRQFNWSLYIASEMHRLQPSLHIKLQGVDGLQHYSHYKNRQNHSVDLSFVPQQEISICR